MDDRTFLATNALTGILAKGTNNLSAACADARVAADTLLLGISPDQGMDRVTFMAGILITGIFAKGENNIPAACTEAKAAAAQLVAELLNTPSGIKCKHNHTLASRCMKCGEVLRI